MNDDIKDIIPMKQFDLLISCLVISVVIYILNEINCGYIMNYLILGFGIMCMAIMTLGALGALADPIGIRYKT